MEAILSILGFLAFLIGWVWILVLAFKEHIGWGLAVFFFSPLISVIYGFMRWGTCKIPLIIHIVGFVLLIYGAFSAGVSMQTAY